MVRIMSENEKVEAFIIDLTPEEIEELVENGQLILPFNGSFIEQDPVFSLEVVEY